MKNSGRRWTVHDRNGNPIYLAQERWKHIVEENNHPEMLAYENFLQLTLKKGRRRQEPLNPRKYRYIYPFADLPDDVNHIVVIVLFGYDIDKEGRTIPNNYVATAFFKHIRLKG
ncbi:MAG: hypothetical protein ABIG63_09170 [Chloroflexota bacterium]